MADCMTDWMTDCMTDLMVDWMADWMAGLLFYFLSVWGLALESCKLFCKGLGFPNAHQRFYQSER